MGYVVALLILQALAPARPAELVGYWVELDRVPGTPDCGSRGTHDRLYIELRPHGRMRLHTWPCLPQRQRFESGHWAVTDGRLVLSFRSGSEESYEYRRGERSLELVAADGTHSKMRYEFLPVRGGRHPSKLVGTWEEGVERQGIDDPRHSVDMCLRKDGYGEDTWYCITEGGRWQADDEFLSIGYLEETYRYRINGRTLIIETSKGELIELHRTSSQCEP